MGPYQRTPKEVARAIRYSGLGVRSVGPVGDFLEKNYAFHYDCCPSQLNGRLVIEVDWLEDLIESFTCIMYIYIYLFT